MEIHSWLCITEQPTGLHAVSSTVYNIDTLQKRVVDAILTGNVDQYSISARELAFKVCPWHDV